MTFQVSSYRELPNFALLRRIHFGAFGALEVHRELFHVAHWSEDAEHAGRVDAGGDAHLHRLCWLREISVSIQKKSIFFDKPGRYTEHQV